MIRRHARHGALGAILGMLVGCQSLDSYVAVRVTAAASVADSSLSQLGSQPSTFTREALAAGGLRWQARKCDTLPVQLADMPLAATQRAFAIAELHFLAAHSPACSKNRQRALLEAARGAYLLLGTEAADHAPPPTLVVALYNRAVTELVTHEALPNEALTQSRAFPWDLAPESRALLAQHDRLLDSERIVVTGLLERHRRAGIGAALVATQSASHLGGLSANYFKRGAAQAVTALLRFEGATPRMELLRSSDHETVVVGDREWPLHADFTAPYAWSQHGSKWRRAGIASAFFPSRLSRARGIYLLEPLSADKTPILMIHGLAAGPQAWRNITNELLGTADIRRRYQVWHYFYPTGQAYLQSAAELRQDLHALRLSAQQRSGKPLPPLIVIGHSQGGLLARALVTEPGDALWNTVFTVPAERLSVDDADRDAFRAALRYAITPDIARVVFMETPHLGAAATDRSALLRLLNVFVDVPDDLARKLRHLAKTHASDLTPFARGIAAAGGPSPLTSLAPSSPLTQAFGQLPLSPATHYHSIIAARDEFLTYDSAHLPAGDSELLLPARHQETDGAASIAEIVRILRLD